MPMQRINSCRLRASSPLLYACALAILVAGGSRNVVAANRPTDVCTEYLRAWIDGDAKQMYSMIDAADKRHVSLEQFTAAFSVRVPFSERRYILRPVRFGGVKLREGTGQTVDFKVWFTVESLLGSEASEIFCRDKRLSLGLAEARLARERAMYLLYDAGNVASPYVSLGFVFRLYFALRLEDMLWFLPSGGSNHARGGGLFSTETLDSKAQIVIDTSTTDATLWRVASASSALRVNAFQTSSGGGIRSPVVSALGGAGGREQSPPFSRKGFDGLLRLMGLAEP